jgi:membrane-bound lytic murein transglycosylase D
MLRSQSLKLILVLFLFVFISASARNSMRLRNVQTEAATRSLRSFNVFEPNSYSHHYGLQVYISKYNKMQAELFTKIQKRDQSKLTLIGKVFMSYKLPAELKYLAIVESEMKNTATSKVGAVGVWQLMPSTAMDLGLRVDSTVDERTHLKKSTKAAALYLRDLHRSFNDWSLAIAAYNCGPGPVYKAIKKAGSRNYWDLQQYLPKETRHHVKKLMATQVFFEGKSSLADNYDGALARK